MPDSEPRSPEPPGPAGAADPASAGSRTDDYSPAALDAAPARAAFALPDFGATTPAPDAVQPIDLLRDVGLHVKIELGRCRMLLEDVLKLSEGSIVELDKLAGDPVDIYANDRLVARGEVLVLNDNFCVRVNEILAEVTREFE